MGSLRSWLDITRRTLDAACQAVVNLTDGTRHRCGTDRPSEAASPTLTGQHMPSMLGKRTR
jgi:hypothetical protein